MNKGVKIALGLTMGAVVFYIVYLMFLKKNSSIYVLKGRSGNDGTDNTSDAESNAPSESNSSNSSTSPAPAPCLYPATPFKKKSEGDKFREWVNDTYPSVAKDIDLDRSGAYDNCFIRKAFAHKVSGGRTLGNLFLTDQNSTPEVINTDKNQFEGFIQRLKDRNIPFRISSNGAVLIRIHSNESDMDSYYYQFAFAKDGKWAVAMWRDVAYQGDADIWAQGLYNLSSTNAGTRLTVTSGNDKQGTSLKGWSKTANNDNVWTMQELIQRYWSPVMSDEKAKTLKAVAQF